MTPDPMADEVLGRAAHQWDDAMDHEQEPGEVPTLTATQLAALLAHGSEHGVTITTDGHLIPALAAPRPDPLTEDERMVVASAKSLRADGYSIHGIAGDLFAIIDRLTAESSPSPKEQT